MEESSKRLTRKTTTRQQTEGKILECPKERDREKMTPKERERQRENETKGKRETERK